MHKSLLTAALAMLGALGMPGAAAMAQAAAPPAVRAVSDAGLPTVVVSPHVIHTVPNGGGPGAPQPPPPRFLATIRPAPRFAPRPGLSGTAVALGAVRLRVSGLPLILFGVRPPGARDLCTLAAGGTQPCEALARHTLAAHLGARGVRCTAPPGQRGIPGYVCHNAAGIDLADLLVRQGLAIADTRHSYQYFNAEESARAARRGLWRAR